MSLADKIEKLNASINASFDQAFTALRRDLQDQLRASHQDLHRRIESFAPELPGAFVVPADLAPAAERLRADERRTAFAGLRAAFAALDRARGQSEVLAALLAATPAYSSRAAVLLWRGGELRGWGGAGFNDSEAALRGMALVPAAGSAWSQESWGSGRGPARLAAADCAVLCGLIESPVPAHGFLVPIVLRDQVVALLYADRLAPDRGEAAADADRADRADRADSEDREPGAGGDGAAPDALPLDALQSLVYVAELAIETLPFRQRAATATLLAEAPGGVAPAEAGGPVPEAAGAPGASAPGEGAAGAAGTAADSAAAAPPSAALAAAPDIAALAAAPDIAASAAAPDIAALAAAPDIAASAAVPEDVAATDSAAAAGAPGLVAGHGPSGAGPLYAGAPFAVTPATLYDTPSVPVVQQTAEIPRPASWIPPAGGSPYLDEHSQSIESAESPESAQSAERLASVESEPVSPPVAAAPATTAGAGTPAAGEPPAAAASATATAPAAASSDTVMLPRGMLRDAGGAAWARRTSELAEVPPAPPAGPPPLAAESPEAPPQLLPDAAPPAPAAAAGASGFSTVLSPRESVPAAMAGITAPAGTPGALRTPGTGTPGTPGTATPATPPIIAATEPALAATPGTAANLRVVPPIERAPLPTAAAGAGGSGAAGSPHAVPPPREGRAEGAPSGPIAVPPPAGTGFEPLRTTGTLSAGTPEVRPPSGVQGPGWAFATTRLAAAPGDEAQHEEARRLARLLVSEIKLYNEEQVEAGRRNRDIYERLREDIDRSRQMYEERVEPRLAKSTDYFYQELVRILAAGDSKALGI